LIREGGALRFAYVSEIGQRQSGTQASVTKALDRVIAASERLAADPTGANAENYVSLLEQLRALRERAARGEPIPTDELGGIVRWVSDWLPDEQFSLIGLLGSVVRASQRNIGSKKKRASR
jgi:hypothetical protein